MPRVVRLLAILAPGSVEAEVGRLQQAVFASRGLVSAIALPPLVPVLFLSRAAPDRLPERPGEEVPRAWRATATGLAVSGDCLFLGLDTRGAWPALRADSRFPGAPGLFPEAEGFFLGSSEQDPGATGGWPPTGEEIAAPVLAFSSADLAIVSIEVPDTGPWWTRLTWQIEDRRPLRGRR